MNRADAFALLLTSGRAQTAPPFIPNIVGENFRRVPLAPTRARIAGAGHSRRGFSLVEVLVAVARVLHDWAPTDPFLDLGKDHGQNWGGLSLRNPEAP